MSDEMGGQVDVFRNSKGNAGGIVVGQEKAAPEYRRIEGTMDPAASFPTRADSLFEVP